MSNLLVPSGPRLGSALMYYGNQVGGPKVDMRGGQMLSAAQTAFLPEDLPTRGSYRPTCTLFWGRRGTGKTLGMTALGMIMRQAYDARGRGYFRVMANYHVDFANYVNPMLVDQLVFFPGWAENLLVMVDEILAYFPSRRSLARPNLHFATFLQQIRKRRVEMVFTCQFPQNMDNQMLQQIDFFVRPELFNRKRSMRLHVYDWWGQFTGRIWTKKWPPIDEPEDWIVDIHNIQSIFGQYSTEEVVAPLFSDARDEIIGQQWGQEMAIIQETDIAALKAKAKADDTGDDWDKLLRKQPAQFLVSRLIDDAKRLDPSIKHAKGIVPYLEARGYTIHQDKSTFIAKRGEPEVDE